MSQSLYTAMGGINAATTELQVIANNVANINTTAFKASSVQFSDVFYRTMSSGSVGTDSNGGTNPIQIGVGVKVGSITKDFTSGSWVSTGKSTDLMIQGSGFFTATDGIATYYTRAGDFSFDSEGNLVTSNGYKVCGTDSIMSASSSRSTVSVPLTICADVKGNPDVGNVNVKTLNNINNNITQGEFNVSITTASGTDTIKVNLTSDNVSGTTSQLVTAIQTALNSTSEQGHDLTGIVVTAEDGIIKFDLSGLEIDGTAASATSVNFATPSLASGVTNFVTVAELGNVILDPVAKTCETKILDQSVVISQLSSANESISETSEAINSDGSIQVTYDDGSMLSVKLNPVTSKYEFMYTTADNVKITGTKCYVDPNVAQESNFVIQLATIRNPDGLMAMGSNMFKAGPNSGDVIYTVAGQMGAGDMESGGLEASNVDLSEELSNMILAQRAVQANSRVFSTTSNIMDTVVNMGR